MSAPGSVRKPRPRGARDRERAGRSRSACAWAAVRSLLLACGAALVGARGAAAAGAAPLPGQARARRASRAWPRSSRIAARSPIATASRSRSARRSIRCGSIRSELSGNIEQLPRLAKALDVDLQRAGRGASAATMDREFLYVARGLQPADARKVRDAADRRRQPGARIPPLLPGRRSDRPSARLHRRRRRRPGRRRARLRQLARRRGRRQARHPGQPGQQGRGRREHPARCARGAT